MFNDIRIRVISREIPQTSITKISFKLHKISFKSHRDQWVKVLVPSLIVKYHDSSRRPCLEILSTRKTHYNDVMMSAIASQITSLTIVYSIVYSDADQRKHQSSASLAFVWGIHRWPVNSPHKWPVTRKMFPFDDVIMFLLFHHDMLSLTKSSITKPPSLSFHYGNTALSNFTKVLCSFSFHHFINMGLGLLCKTVAVIQLQL